MSAQHYTLPSFEGGQDEQLRFRREWYKNNKQRHANWDRTSNPPVAARVSDEVDPFPSAVAKGPTSNEIKKDSLLVD